METLIETEIKQTIKEIKDQLPALKAVNPIQSTIIEGSLYNKENGFANCCALFDENLITKYKLGFKNEESVKMFYKSVVYTGFLTFYDTYMKVIEDFGESTILIPFGQFTRILDKYGLISGPFDRYKGSVPDHVLNAIKEADETHCGYVSSLQPIRELKLSGGNDFRDLMRKINIFPFFHAPHWRRSDYIDSKDREEFYDFYMYHGYSYLDSWESDSLGGHLFIAAPISDMIPLKIIKVLPQQKEDPLVCSFVPHVGIIVHTSWGPEGKDVILNLYRMLSNILKKIGENGIIQTIFDDCNYSAYNPSKTPFNFNAKF